MVCDGGQPAESISCASVRRPAGPGRSKRAHQQLPAGSPGAVAAPLFVCGRAMGLPIPSTQPTLAPIGRFSHYLVLSQTRSLLPGVDERRGPCGKVRMLYALLLPLLCRACPPAIFLSSSMRAGSPLAAGVMEPAHVRVGHYASSSPRRTVSAWPPRRTRVPASCTRMMPPREEA